MKTGFERVRRLATAGALGAVGLLGMGSTARAATSRAKVNVILGTDIRINSVVTPGTWVSWSSIDNRTVHGSNVLTGSVPTSIRAFGVNEATINNINTGFNGSNYSGATNSGSLISSSLNDAFDGYGGLFLDGEAYNDADGIVDLTGTTVTTDSTTMSNGLNVYAQVHAFPNRRTLRFIYAISNPTAFPITTRAAFGGDLGSDNWTYVAATSDGDQLVEPQDNWLITHDAGVFGGTATSDPILLHAVSGPGAPVSGTPLQIPGSGNDRISFAYDLTLQPGETQYLTYFVEMHVTMAEAQAAAADYANSTTAGAAGLFTQLPAGMTTSANWGAVTQAAHPVPVGTPFGLALLSGVLGMAAYRRLKKSPS